MKTYKHLYEKLCSFENVEDAYWKARKHKTNNPRVKEFDKHSRLHLCILMRELRTQTYQPQPLRKFVLRDPKTRIICVSEFKDRVVHHVLVNVLQPLFQPRFIHDSYASQKGKGTISAINRFHTFSRKVTRNGAKVLGTKNANLVEGFALKADIRHYFETIDHDALMNIIGKRIKDKQVLWLCKTILNNYNCGTPGRGMPLGNWTSQFFANVYLNELDQFVKHQLKVKYYIRYVDDFIILHKIKHQLITYKQQIADFLKRLKLELHPNKCKIVTLEMAVSFLGFRIFYYYKLVRAKNLKKIKSRLTELIRRYHVSRSDAQQVIDVFRGWNAYAMQGNTYHLRQRLKKSIEDRLIKKINKH